jgi:hypothetical protein
VIATQITAVANPTFKEHADGKIVFIHGMIFRA